MLLSKGNGDVPQEIQGTPSWRSLWRDILVDYWKEAISLVSLFAQDGGGKSACGIERRFSLLKKYEWWSPLMFTNAVISLKSVHKNCQVREMWRLIHLL
jgi:hypothetical protein